ncbi:alpha/beta fold hydrolase [Streptomyces candidus]|uniref:Pimeloyl-ACP methyl ester carboxylesterase n=1 Tax=Streptomyces candidus TaxID=67283 RepID=A0A7X0HJ37_9ACTN|nr:alpha/beta hydrolase [Streptomyces candidus]MBB6438609.1 pimeloyl-ACP methyl ester carboxylesterase [Streptomyces candidus]GHH45333.1 hydrolase [Streptomyces candidus]
MTSPETRTLSVAGATLTYDVRPGSGGEAPLFLVGSPMSAAGFVTLASHFTDRTVITYDPRGVDRSPRTDGAAESSPEEHAEDLARIVEAVGVETLDVFASSGGAVNALALVARHPALVRTLVAHEPPIAEALPDREAALRVFADMHETYLRDGLGAGMAKFIAAATHQGEFPEDWADGPAPDPAAFGLPTEDDGARDDALLGQNLRNCTGYEPDFAALRAASTRLVIAAGRESEQEMTARAAVGVAERLGLAPTWFPSHHGGFLGGEFGQEGQPAEFAKTLRSVLDGQH